jgi:WD40 repeat protein
MADATTNWHFLAGLLLAAVLGSSAAGQAPSVRLDVFGDPLPEEAISRLGTVRFRHGGEVDALQFTPDGKVLISQGGDGVRTWDAATGKQIHAIQSERLGDRCQPEPLSDDGKLLATASKDGICLWDVEAGRLQRTFGSGAYRRAGISRDGKRIAAVRVTPAPEAVEMWDTGTGRRLWSVSAAREFLSFTPDGKSLIVVRGAAAGTDDVIHSLDTATGRERRRITFARDGVTRFAVSPDGHRLAVLFVCLARIRVWEMDSGKELPRLDMADDLRSRPEELMALAFTPDGTSLLAAGRDDALLRWDVATGKQRGCLGKGMTGAAALSVSPDGKTVAVGHPDGWIRVIDRTTGADLDPAIAIPSSPSQAAITPDGRTVVTASRDGFVLWDAATGRERRRIAIPRPHSDYLLADDGRTAFIYKQDDTLIWLDLLTGKERSRLALRPIASDPTVKGIGPGGKVLAVGPVNGKTFSVLDSATGKRLQDFGEPDHELMKDVSFTADGRTLVAYHSDSTARVWDEARGARGLLLVAPARQEGREIGATVATVRGVVSPDGTWVAYADGFGELTLFDIATGRAVHRFQHLPSGAHALAFSPDSRVLAWSSWANQVIHLVETASGKERHTLAGHRGDIEALAFSADGTRLVSSSFDTSALVWDLTGRLATRGSSQALSAADLNACWAALAGYDASCAYQAMRKLTASPEEALPYLRERLRPVRPVPAKRLADLITDLDSDRFRTREDAMRELQQLGEQAVAACRAALAERPSPERRRRLQALIERQAHERLILSAAGLRAMRAVEVLEAIGTAEARRHLEELAAGAPEARLTREARAALDRLTRRAVAP